MPAQEVHLGPPGIVERTGLRRTQQLESGVIRARVQAGLRGSQSTPGTPCRVLRQRDRPLQERSRRSDPTPSLRPVGRALKFCGYLLIRSQCRAGAVPGAPVRVRRGVGGVREGAMHAVAVIGCSCAVHGGPGEWVRELDSPADLEQPGIDRKVGCSHVETQDRGRAAEQHRVAHRLRSRGQDEQLCTWREPEQPPGVALLDLACHRPLVRQPEPAGEVHAVPGARQLKQRERVAMAFRDDLLTDSSI